MMGFESWRFSHALFRAFTAFLLTTFVTAFALAQGGKSAQVGSQVGTYERTYRQSKAVVERVLKELQPSLSGRLPALEGFAVAGDHPLNRFERAYYQSAVQVSSTPKGGTVVRVSTKVTAWYADAIPSHSGYQLLTSNGRLESDLLDELAERLASTPGAVGTGGTGDETFPVASSPVARDGQPATEERIAGKENPEPSISAPAPKSQQAETPFSSSWSSEKGLSAQPPAELKNSKHVDQATGLQAEAASLEEIVKNQAHPKNLVAIKKSGTPVVATPSLTGKTLFLASARDEFEMLDYNADWVHVRISGLSRGWIWRTSLEMPEGISDVPLTGAKAAPVVADLFQVTREETAPFPGDWGPLRGKNVKIVSVQKVQENEKDSGAQAKLEFAKSLLDKNYADLAARSPEVSGIVLIFDSVDGGMIAATLPTVQQWKAGALTDAALWHQCYFDPPETFILSSSNGG
jgi:hypothetical protein